MTHLAGRESPRLRIFQAERNLARRQIPATVAMIPLAGAGDVDSLGLCVLLRRRPLLRPNRERDREQERYPERERRNQASHVRPPER